MARCLVVGICGGTGSGKTTVTKRIAAALPAGAVLVLEQDHYYLDLAHLTFEERVAQNFDHPDSIDTPLLVEHVRRLRRGEAVERPVYDFSLYRRLSETVRLEPKPILVIEGILIYESRDLRDQMDIKVFVDTEADIRFIRRLERDVKERGRTVESVIRQYQATVRPMHIEFVEPSKRFADLIIPEGGFNHAGVDLVIEKIKSLNPASAAKQAHHLK